MPGPAAQPWKCHPQARASRLPCLYLAQQLPQASDGAASWHGGGWRGNSSVKQVESAIGRTAGCAQGKVREAQRRLVDVQVVECCSKLDADIKYFLCRQVSIVSLPQVGFECFTLKKIHDEIPALVLDEVVVDTRQVGMDEASQQKHLAFAGFDHFLLARVLLANFLERYNTAAKQEDFCLVHRA